MAWLKVLHGTDPKTTYTQLPVIADPGTDWTLIRDLGDGVNSEPIPVHIELNSSGAVRVRDASQEIVFNVDTSSKAAIVRLVRSGTPAAVPTMAEGQISANIADGKLFLKGAGATVYTFDDDQHTHTIAQLDGAGVSNYKPLVWNGSAWVSSTQLTLTPGVDAAFATNVAITGRMRQTGPIAEIGYGLTYAGVEGAGLQIPYLDGTIQTHLKLEFNPTNFTDSGWGVYHVKAGVEAMSELLTNDSVINGGTY